jgi:hypothetical protein
MGRRQCILIAKEVMRNANDRNEFMIDLFGFFFLVASVQSDNDSDSGHDSTAYICIAFFNEAGCGREGTTIYTDACLLMTLMIRCVMRCACAILVCHCVSDFWDMRCATHVMRAFQKVCCRYLAGFLWRSCLLVWCHRMLA